MSLPNQDYNEDYPAPNSPITHTDLPLENSSLSTLELLGMSSLTKWLWNNLKYISLILLVAQNTSVVIIMRYSRLNSDGGGKLYLTSTAVVIAELLKFTISLLMVLYNLDWDVKKTCELLHLELIVKIKDTAKLAVPAILYTIQNNLLYIALSHLDAVTFQITYQMKIIVTAIFSLIILKRTLTTLKWSSLFLLMVAVVLVQWPSNNIDQEKKFSLIGLVSILLACISSGFSGVYLEKIMKQAETSMWIRNIQLAFMSFCVGMFGVVVTDGKAIYADGFFQGYTYIVLVVITLQAAGGIVVSVVIKYADNILKGFATAVSIIVSSLFSYFVLRDFTPSWFFLLGTGLVLISSVMYSRPSEQKQTIPITNKTSS